MTSQLDEAARRLCDVLEAENAALLSLDYGKVGRFFQEKTNAIDALNKSTAARSKPSENNGPPLAVRLEQLAGENKRLLEQAIKVQNRIMSALANAARHTQKPKGYGAGGRPSLNLTTSAVALRVRA